MIEHSMRAEVEARVKAFVAEETRTNADRLTLDTTLFGDLGVDGIDGWELIVAFGKAFDVDTSGFQHDRHFGPEAGCLFPITLYFYFRELVLREDPHHVVGLTPISIRDLVEAVEAKRWLI